MSFAETGKPYIILRFQPIRYGQEYWDNLVNNNENISYIESDAKNRDEFLEEIKSGKFNEVNFIAHTFQSVKETGIFDRELLEIVNKFTKVKGIAHCGAGYDQIDTNACKEFGIQLSNVPDKVSAATADTNIFLILCTTRNFQIGHDNLMKGEWMKHMTGAGTPIGHSIQDKVVGILGMGAIGRAVRDRLSGFGLKKIVYYNRKRLSPEEEKGCEICDSIDEFLAQSDVISINMPLNSHTHHFINKELVSKMKDGVVIVNTARGPIVDERAIKEGIKSGKIYGYGADVFENEPNIDMEFVSMPKVVSTPHLGAGTYETVKSMEEIVVQNVESFYKTGKVLNMVPELQEIF